jgi:hypothetical protein
VNDRRLVCFVCAPDHPHGLHLKFEHVWSVFLPPAKRKVT